MKSVSILMIVDNIAMSGAFWRHSGPFTRLKKMVNYPIRFGYMQMKDITWAHIAEADIVFMQRPFSAQHKQIVQLCMDYKTKIWLDCDDDLFHIPHDNETHRVYMDRENQHNIISMILAADVVTTSTIQLKRVLDRYRPKKDTIITKNSVLPERWSFRNVKERAPVKRVMWRGSKHHQKDLLHMKDEIIKLANKYPKVEFYFVGWKPWYIFEETENCFTVPTMDVTTYFKCLHSIRPDLVMVPLYDNEFNRSKSNIAAIEGLMAGGIVVGPDWEEWQNIPGVFNYSNDLGNSFYEVMDKLLGQIETSDDHLKLNEEGWNFVLKEYDLDQTNLRRSVIIDHLVGFENGELSEIIKADQIKAYRSVFEEKPCQDQDIPSTEQTGDVGATAQI